MEEWGGGRLVLKSGGRQVGVEEWGETGWCGRAGRQAGVEEWGGDRLVWKRGEAACT